MFPRRNPNDPMPPQSGSYETARGLGYQPELGRRGAPQNRGLLAPVNRQEMEAQRAQSLGALGGLIGRFGAQAQGPPTLAGALQRDVGLQGGAAAPRQQRRRPAPIPAQALKRKGRSYGQYGVVTPTAPVTQDPVDRGAPFRQYARRQHNPDVALAQQGVRRVADIRPARAPRVRAPRVPRQQRTLIPSVALPAKAKPKPRKKAVAKADPSQPKITKFTAPKAPKKESKPKKERTTPAPKEKVREERTAPQVQRRRVKQTEQTRPAGRGVRQTEVTRPTTQARVKEAEGTASGLKSKKKSMRY